VLCAIDITWAFSGKITCALGNSLADFNVLVTFESMSLSGYTIQGYLLLLPVQKNSTKTLLKVLLQTSNNLVQDVGWGTASLSSRLFVLEVIIENNIDGLSGGKWNELEIFCDILPIIDENRLNVVGDDELDRRSGVKLLFLKFTISHDIISNGSETGKEVQSVVVVSDFRVKWVWSAARNSSNWQVSITLHILIVDSMNVLGGASLDELS
jgi:hypothetical protein